MSKQNQSLSWFLAVSVLIARAIQMATSTLDGVRGYGDFLHFFQLASLEGWPYINYWIEFPPFFPILIKVIHWVSGGREHGFDYILGMLLVIACSLSILLFAKILHLINPDKEQIIPLLAYSFLLVSVPYNWWYFDPIPVLFLLLGIYCGLTNGIRFMILAISMGALFKWFPLLGVLITWDKRKIKNFILITALSAGIVVIAYGVIWLINPEFTISSLKSQGVKGSWETVWALVDGNYQTGNFGALSEYRTPLESGKTYGNPARIPPWLTLVLFAVLGIWGLFRNPSGETIGKVAAIGWGLCLLFLWSLGWSPQWILYLIPLILLPFPMRLALLYNLTLVGINILEWPILLSRGWFWSLNYTVPIRFMVLALLAYGFLSVMRGTIQAYQPTDPPDEH
jgi:hypothetical protein